MEFSPYLIGLYIIFFIFAATLLHLTIFCLIGCVRSLVARKQSRGEKQQAYEASLAHEELGMLPEARRKDLEALARDVAALPAIMVVKPSQESWDTVTLCDTRD